MESFGLRWCQRIQLLIIDLASSQQQNRPPGPKGGTGRYQRWTDTRAHNLKGKGEQLRIVHVDYNELCLLRVLTGIPHQVWAVTMPRDPFPLLHPPILLLHYHPFPHLGAIIDILLFNSVAIHISICNTSSSIIDSGNAAYIY